MTYIPGYDYKPTPAEARYLAAQDARRVTFHDYAILHGEAAAQEWLAQQPPIAIERKDAPPETGEASGST